MNSSDFIYFEGLKPELSNFSEHSREFQVSNCERREDMRKEPDPGNFSKKRCVYVRFCDNGCSVLARLARSYLKLRCCKIKYCFNIGKPS
jgi:hypothetical protein